MDTILTKTASTGSEIVIKIDGSYDLFAFVDGTQVSSNDAYLGLPKPQKAANGLMLGGYLRDAKIGLTVDEARTVKAAIDARQAARKATFQRATREYNSRNRVTDPGDLNVEMDREDSAW